MNWSSKEIESLRVIYPNSPKQDICTALPNRSWSAIVTKACDLNINRRFRFSPSRIAVNICREDARWISCAIDTEGSISLTRCKVTYKGQDRFYLHPNINIKNCSLEWLTQVGKLSKVNYSISSHKYVTGNGRINRIVFALQFSGVHACALLLQIEPYFIIKRKQAQLIIEFMKIREKIAFGDIHHWYYTSRQFEIYHEMRKLNQCGRWPNEVPPMLK